MSEWTSIDEHRQYSGGKAYVRRHRFTKKADQA